jgi:hypothetical protein
MISKTCKKCKTVLSVDNFWKNSSIKDGYFNKCKSCAVKVSDENALKKQKYLQSNLWTCSCCNKELELTLKNFHKRNDNETGFQHRCKNCLKKDPKRYNRLINKDDLELYLIDRYHGCRSRSNRKGIQFDLTVEFLKRLWDKQSGRCAITGINMTHSILEGKIKTNLSVDKINAKLGYTQKNIQLVCNIVNIMKSDMDIKELKYFCNLIIQGHE